jgi:hypothetical protein
MKQNNMPQQQQPAKVVALVGKSPLRMAQTTQGLR